MKRRFIEIAAACTGAAGLVHLAFVGSHAAEALWLGAAFLATGVAQLVLAFLMLGQDRSKTLLLVCLLNSAIILGWGLSRTVGLPSGAGSWTRELPGLADVTASSLEALSVLLTVLALPMRARRLVKRSVLAGALGLFLLSGSSALGRTIDGKTPLMPAHSHRDGVTDHHVTPHPADEEARIAGPQDSHPHP
ncbi:MAG TPA: hypothetical protein VND22_01080 [Actinomycetota bacterium]|nr:hypothetical protein [Actinomycetota bacterium]